jgi:hypothetical protein
MKANVVGVEKLRSLAEEILDTGLPLDVIEPEIGESAEMRTDKELINTLLEAYGDGDLVLPLGKLEDGSSLVALEIDTAKGGDQLLKNLWAKCPVSKTPVIQSAEGLVYFLMREAGEVLVDRVPLGDGMALVSAGNYIIIPPHDAGNRSDGWWKNFPTNISEVADVPEKLAALLNR